MSNLYLIIAAITAGAAIAIAIWAGRAWLQRKFAQDTQWMLETYHRFHPEPINAAAYMIVYYASFALWLLVLLAIIPSVLIAFGFWIISLFLPRIYIEWAWQRRLKKIDLLIPQCVATLGNSMRAGLTLVQGITRLSEQAPEPIRGEFKIMANQYGYGADMETVIRNAKARLNLANFNLFASALLLNREMGGDVSETLSRISKSLDKLYEMRKTVEAHTSEGRTNIKVLLIAPFFMLLLMSLVDSRGVLRLFTTSQGIAVLTIAFTMAGTGVYVANRITKSEI